MGKMIKRMSVDRMIDQIIEGYKAGERYCFILGSGASVSSGIPTGSQLMTKWRDALKAKGRAYVEETAKDIGCTNYEFIFEENYVLSGKDYFTLFDLNFSNQEAVIRQFLEETMGTATPSLGYYSLAMILSYTENNIVITTNFDHLIEDALIYCQDKLPQVITHESLAPYLNSASGPVIAKVHRDLLLRPFNRQEEVSSLSEEWTKPLERILRNKVAIVIGYSGSDNSLMSLIRDSEVKGLYWCDLCDADDAIPEKLRETLEIEETANEYKSWNRYWVKNARFDEVMFALDSEFKEMMGNSYPKQNIGEEIEERAKKRAKTYDESLKKVIRETILSDKLLPSLNEEPSGRSQRYQNALGLAAEKEINKKKKKTAADYLLLMKAYNRQGEYQNAVDQFAEAKKVHSKIQEAAYYDMLYEDGYAYFFLNNYEESLSCYREALRLRPEGEQLYFNIGVVLENLDRKEEALEAYGKAVELKPDDAEAYNNRGVLLSALGRKEEALEDLEKAIELKPDQAEAYNNRGVLLSDLGRKEEALEEYGKAIELKADNAEAYYNRGSALSALGRSEEALEDYGKAIGLKPDYAEAYYNRGSVLLSLGRNEEALEDYGKAIELKPDDAVAYNNRGNALYRLGRNEEALEAYGKAIELKPDNANAYNNRGWVYKGLGKYEEAAKDFQESINKGLNNKAQYEKLKEVCQLMGDEEKAQQCDQRIAELTAKEKK